MVVVGVGCGAVRHFEMGSCIGHNIDGCADDTQLARRTCALDAQDTGPEPPWQASSQRKKH